MAQKPHILLDFLAFDAGDGGFTAACRALIEICQALPAIDFTVLSSAAGTPEFRRSGFPVLEYTFPRSLRYGINALILPTVARRGRFSAVHSEMSAASPMVGIPSSMTLHDLAFVGNRNAHNTSLGGKMMHWYWNSYYLGALGRTTRIKCISETTSADLQAHNGRNSGVDVVYPWFLPRPPMRSRSYCSDGKLRLVFVGTILPRKNLAFLLEATAQLQRRWELHLVGNIAWGSDVLAPYLERGNIVVHGFVADAVREQIVADSDVLVLPSLAEGFGYPPLEAAALGTPSLLSDIPVFREIAPSQMLFDLADPHVLAQRLEALTPDEIGDLSAAWERTLSAYSFERAVQAHSTFFEALVRDQA